MTNQTLTTLRAQARAPESRNSKLLGNTSFRAQMVLFLQNPRSHPHASTSARSKTTRVEGLMLESCQKGDKTMAHTPGPNNCHRCLPASRSLPESRARLFVILPLPRICVGLREKNNGAGANSGQLFPIAYLPIERPLVTMYAMRCRAQSAPVNTLPIVAFDDTRSSPIEKSQGSFDVSYDA